MIKKQNALCFLKSEKGNTVARAFRIPVSNLISEPDLRKKVGRVTDSEQCRDEKTGIFDIGR